MTLAKIVGIIVERALQIYKQQEMLGHSLVKFKLYHPDTIPRA